MTDNTHYNVPPNDLPAITRICIDTLSKIKNGSTHNTIALALDRALSTAGYVSNLHAIAKESEAPVLDLKMSDMGFPTEVTTAVRRASEPTLGQFEEIYAKLGNKLPKLSVVQYATSVTGVITDYKQAMEVMQPYLKSREISTEAASEYAHAVTLGKLEHNLTMGLSSEFGNRALGEWVRDHPEISSKVLTALGLEDVRKMQDLYRSYEFS